MHTISVLSPQMTALSFIFVSIRVYCFSAQTLQQHGRYRYMEDHQSKFWTSVILCVTYNLIKYRVFLIHFSFFLFNFI